MKEDVERPDELVDITRLTLKEIRPERGGARSARWRRTRKSPTIALIRQRYPLLTQAILAGRLRAAPQHGDERRQPPAADALPVLLRHGHAVQQTRARHRLRAPSRGSTAIHAILGSSDKCVATHRPTWRTRSTRSTPSSVRGAGGRRAHDPRHRVPSPAGRHAGERQQPPAWRADRGHRAAGADLAEHSYYLKVRDRASYAFALVAVAAALELDGGTIRQARVVLGRRGPQALAEPEAEAALSGKPVAEESFRRAAEAALAERSPRATTPTKSSSGSGPSFAR